MLRKRIQMKTKFPAINEQFLLKVKENEFEWGSYKKRNTFVIYTRYRDETNLGLFFVFLSDGSDFFTLYHGVYFKNSSGDFIFNSSEKINFEEFFKLEYYILNTLGFKDSLTNLLDIYYDFYKYITFNCF